MHSQDNTNCLQTQLLLLHLSGLEGTSRLRPEASTGNHPIAQVVRPFEHHALLSSVLKRLAHPASPLVRELQKQG